MLDWLNSLGGLLDVGAVVAMVAIAWLVDRRRR